MTSLTNNVLNFNNGSIKDVRNDLNCALPISVSQLQTFKYSSSGPRTATISGNPGEIVSARVSGEDVTLKITSNGGSWIYSYVSKVGIDGQEIVNLGIFPWKIGSNGPGAISLQLQPYEYTECMIAVVAYRLY